MLKQEMDLGSCEDWTKDVNISNVDTAAFADLMNKVKEGQDVDWECPFCGGKVGLLEQKGSQTLIGCDSCDMRITLDCSVK